jgi:homoserine dehydrogenase
MVATHLEELVHLQLENRVALLYEASAGASIPIIRNLEEYYDNELLHFASRDPERNDKLHSYPHAQ